MFRFSEAQSDCCWLILKPHGQNSRRQDWLLLSKEKPSCVYSILKPHVQRFRKPVRPLLSEAKPSYIYSILKPPGHSSRSRSDRCWARQSEATYTQTVAPNSIAIPIHVVLELNKHTSTFPCLVAVWLRFWKSEHDETRKLATGRECRNSYVDVAQLCLAQQRSDWPSETLIMRL